MDNINDIRLKFRREKAFHRYRGNNTIEIQNAQFLVTDNSIFGTPNKDYIDAEMRWYRSQSLNVNDLFEMYGKEVQIWKDTADKDGFINSNYGWCVHSKENGDQFSHVLRTLEEDPTSRQAVMVYTRPTMHTDSKEAGRHDFMCTTHVQYFINYSDYGNAYLEASVYMRSNDAVYGFNNDLAWQREVLYDLADQLGVNAGAIVWNAGSLHVYPRHYGLIDGS